MAAQPSSRPRAAASRPRPFRSVSPPRRWPPRPASRRRPAWLRLASAPPRPACALPRPARRHCCCCCRASGKARRDVGRQAERRWQDEQPEGADVEADAAPAFFFPSAAGASGIPASDFLPASCRARASPLHPSSRVPAQAPASSRRCRPGRRASLPSRRVAASASAHSRRRATPRRRGPRLPLPRPQVPSRWTRGLRRRSAPAPPRTSPGSAGRCRRGAARWRP